MFQGFHLRTLGSVWSLGAFVVGLAFAWGWFASTSAWQAHLMRAYIAGVTLYDTLSLGTPPPENVTVSSLSPQEAVLADQGAFGRLSDIAQPKLITNVSIRSSGTDVTAGSGLSLAVVSDNMGYQLSSLANDTTQTPPQKLGTLTRLLATYCSEPIVFARQTGGQWLRVDGRPVWGCAAAPPDYRLALTLATAVLLAAILTHVANISASFGTFAHALRNRRRLGGPENYSTKGPEELRDIVSAVNSYLEAERAQLSRRALMLSGVSHDLGTPATRLRLRAALIEDADLRDKLVNDIDRMTGMIDSVLTYTRSELSTEEPRRLSLTSLLEALVADYQDLGKAVSTRQTAPAVVEGGRSVFAARSGLGSVSLDQPILVTARPIALQRAISNLIENALKYGRRALVSLEATSDSATITIEDEGTGTSADDLQELVAPFRRGANVGSTKGFGLGLAIASAVAEQHGGRLYFETGAHGLRARFEIKRG